MSRRDDAHVGADRRAAANGGVLALLQHPQQAGLRLRSEEHTSELQSLMRISYAVFCLKKKTTKMRPSATAVPVARYAKHIEQTQPAPNTLLYITNACHLL